MAKRKKVNGKGPGGQPTKYRPEYCEAIVEFMRKKVEYDEKGKRQPFEMPWFSSFADEIGVCRDTLYEWASKHAEFSYSMRKAKGLQEDLFLACALNGVHQPIVSIFTLKNRFGWTDRQEFDVKGSALAISMTVAPARAELEEPRPKALAETNEKKGLEK